MMKIKRNYIISKKNKHASKEIKEKINDLFEEVNMDIDTEDRCTRDIGHIFMIPYGISDKDFSDDINKNLPRLAAAQYSVSRNILRNGLDILIMDSE